MKYHRLVGVVVVWWLALISLVHAAPVAQCFPESAQCITGDIQFFWEQNGGLPVFGLPIGAATQMTVDGQQLTTQQFERARIEIHPNLAAPYTIQLALLGADVFAQQTGMRIAPATDRDAQDKNGRSMATRDDCAWFDATQQYVCGEFYAYWRTHGIQFDGKKAISYAESLALFGLPISAPMTQTLNGTAYTVQYFERARFEYHPENPIMYRVQMGLLGREIPVSTSVTPTNTPVTVPNTSLVPTPTMVLLPASDLDTFRNNMPPFGYWNSTTSYPVVLAVSELHYVDQITTINNGGLYQNFPPKKMKYVVGLFNVINNRPHGSDAVIVDYDYITLVDFEGTVHTAELLTDRLNKPMKRYTLGAGKRYAREIVFVIPTDSAVAQIKAEFPNVAPITVELRVWPHVP